MRRGLAGIEPTQARPNGAEYARHNLSATAGILLIHIIDIMHFILKLTLVMIDSSFFDSFSDEVLNVRYAQTSARLLAMPFAFCFKLERCSPVFPVTDASGIGTPSGM